MAVTQLCTVHLTRNILAKVKPTDKQEIANQMKEVLNLSLTKELVKNPVALK